MEPVAREWKIKAQSGSKPESVPSHPLGNPALGYGGVRPLLDPRAYNNYPLPDAPSEVTWHGSWADRAKR